MFYHKSSKVCHLLGEFDEDYFFPAYFFHEFVHSVTVSTEGMLEQDDFQQAFWQLHVC